MNLTNFPIVDERYNYSLIAINALAFILENQFIQLAPYFVLTFMYQERFSADFYNDILDKVFQNCKAPPMQLVGLSRNFSRIIPGARDLNLILVDSYESFRAIDVISYTAGYDHNEYYYILLQNNQKHLWEEMEQIFNYCWKNYIINCNVQLQNAKGEILIYTYYPFTSENCGKATVRLINQFKDQTLVSETLFPKKLLNFHLCALRLATWHIPPFIFLKKFSNGSRILERGLEARLINEVARILNFTIVVKVPPSNEKRGTINGNNLTGALQMLHEYTADMSLGYYRLTLARDEVATSTISYYQDVMIFCVAVHAYEFSSLEILLFSFKHLTWLSFLAILIFVLLSIWIVQKNQRFYPHLFPNHTENHTFLNVFLMVLGMPSMLCLNWMFLSLILRTIYQALLFHLIRTHPTNKLPTTINDLIANNYIVVLNGNGYWNVEEAPFMSAVNVHILNDSKESSYFKYVEEQQQRNLVAIGPKDFLDYYMEKFGKKKVLVALKQNIFAYSLTMYLTKHSYLIDQFDDTIRKFYSVGLIKAWRNQEMHYLRSEERDFIKESYLTLEDIYMIFVVLVTGHCFAIFIFLLEILPED